MTKLDLNKTGLVAGIFLAVIHLVWSVLVLAVPTYLQSFLNWVLGLHSLQPYLIITSFNLLNAILLLVVVFIIGFLYGAVFAALWNWLIKEKGRRK